MDQVRKLRIDDGDELRDLLYRPATVWLTDGSRWEAFIPGLYVDTASHSEDGIRTGAGVDWVERDGVMRGLGSRTFLFAEEELTLGEFRQVEVRCG
jgi:Protein of avirulence locus involved in temperature-dependent protein secretion